VVLDLTKIPFLQQEDNGPFTDEMVRRMVDVHNTQHGIIKYMEAMAQVMAEAAIASSKALGDAPSHAVDRWIEVVRERAKELIVEKREDSPMQAKMRKQLAKGKVIDGR
jgi:hypothetical protein